MHFFELLLIFAVGILLHAMLDPEFREFAVDKALHILSFFSVLTCLTLLSGVIHSHFFKRSFMVNIFVLIPYGMGICGLYLMRRSLVLPTKKRYVTLIMGFMLVILSLMFIETLYIEELKRGV